MNTIVNNILIREIRVGEIDVLDEMLYQAVYQKDLNNPIPRDIINDPKIRVYIKDFGNKKDDYCLVAVLNAKIVGAVWVRILSDEVKGYGNIDDKTPEFAISLLKDYRNKGLGTLLMKKMISYLIESGYRQTSLSVDKENYAFNLYKKLGFEIIKENDEDYIMVLKLTKER